MDGLVRDTAFGQLVRWLSGKKMLRFPDEMNPESCLQTIFRSNQQPERGSQDQEKTSPGGNTESGEQPQEERIVVVSWYGPDDPENPLNWSRGYKILVVTIISALNFGFYVGSSIYSLAVMEVMDEFHATEVVATLGLSLFVIGYGLGPMIFSPLSEMPTIGRSRIYFWTLLVFILVQLPAGFAVNLAMLLVFRFVAGFFGGPVLASGGGTINDMYAAQDVLFWLGLFGSFGVLGPVFGPLLGGFTTQSLGWRWTIWDLTLITTAVLIPMFFLMPETHPGNIIYRRAKRLRCYVESGQSGLPPGAILKCPSELGETTAADSATTVCDQLAVLGRAFSLIATEPVIFFVDLYSALIYGILYIWFESFPLVFGEIYHFDLGQQGLVFLGIFVGGLITVPCYLAWVERYLAPQFRSMHTTSGSLPPPPPEAVLPPTFVGAVTLPICLFWYGWTARPHIHWIVPLIGSGTFTVSIITLFMPIVTYLVMAYPQYAASVLAGNSLFRATCGFVFPLFARFLFRNLGIGPGNSLLGGLAVGFIPIPFVLYFVGVVTIRAREYMTNRGLTRLSSVTVSGTEAAMPHIVYEQYRTGIRRTRGKEMGKEQQSVNASRN